MSEATEGQAKAYPRAPRLTVTAEYQGKVLRKFELVVSDDFDQPLGGKHADEIVFTEMYMAARKVQKIEKEKP